MRSGWTTKPLVEVATLQRGFDLPTQDRVAGRFPLISSSGISDSHESSAVRGPGVITGRSGSIGNVFFIEDDFWPLNTTLYVKDFHGNDPRFVFHLLKKLDLKQFSSGAGVPTLNRNSVHGELIDVPPIAEQQRIVAILDEAFAGIATAKANAERNLRNARDVLIASKRNIFRSLISAYGSGQLGSVCEFENGDRGKNYPGKQHRVAQGVPFINAGHLGENGLDFTMMDYISSERFNMLGNGKIRPGDILFCLRGSLGKFASVGDLAKGAIASSLVILRPTQKLDIDFLLAFLSSDQCADQIELLKGGAAQPNLGAKDLKRFEIPLPPLPVQREVADQMTELQVQIRMVESIYTRKLTAIDELKQSLLHQAFSGQL